MDDSINPRRLDLSLDLTPEALIVTGLALFAGGVLLWFATRS